MFTGVCNKYFFDTSTKVNFRIIVRTGDDGPALRTCTFVIQNDAGEYVDGKLNDFVVYGYEPNATSGTVPTVVGYGG